MQNPFQSNLRKPWLLLCVTALVIYSIIPVTDESLSDLNEPAALLEAMMFLLAFPLGDLVFLVFDPLSSGIGERFAHWGLALLVGYIQWFHLVPALLRRRKSAHTTLSLSPDAGVAFAPAANARGAETTPLPPRPDDPPVPPFGERGLTPLERVLKDRG